MGKTFFLNYLQIVHNIQKDRLNSKKVWTNKSLIIV